MKFAYPAVFRPLKDGSVLGFFPDLADCSVTAGTLDEAVDLAIEAERDWIMVELEDDFTDLPSISDTEDLDLLPGDEVRTISVTVRLYDGWDE